MIAFVRGALALVGISPAALALYAAAAAAGALFIAGVYHAGYKSASGKCQAAALQAQLEAKEVDLNAANAAAARREQLLADSEAARNQDQQRIAEYEKRIKANPACLLTDDDWRAVDGVRKPARRRSR